MTVADLRVKLEELEQAGYGQKDVAFWKYIPSEKVEIYALVSEDSVGFVKNADMVILND